MTKNIVVFSDGTGQEGGKGTNTNVYRLYNMVLDRSPKQIGFYDRGLGTGLRRFSGNLAGRGISQNICECYRFIFENYEAGDKIYLFGFSRGATTVRSLSGLIHHFGILPKARPELIKQAYKIYKKANRAERESAAKAFVGRHHTMWCTIEFLGVWDTVAALGVPIKSIDGIVDRIPIFKHRFHDLRLSRSVAHAYHALAIDEERRLFLPTLWGTDIADYQSLKQVWFCGVHTDVGGGYPEQAVSDIALNWMVQMAEQRGLEIFPEHNVETSPNANGMMHDSSKWYFRRKVRSWPTKTHGKPRVHESVLERTVNRHNQEDPPYKPWILDGSYEYEVEPSKPLAEHRDLHP